MLLCRHPSFFVEGPRRAVPSGLNARVQLLHQNGPYIHLRVFALTRKANPFTVRKRSIAIYFIYPSL